MSKPYKVVYGIRKTGLTEEGQEREQWTQIGVAFPNQDGSLNLFLHYLPTDLTQTRLHIRDPKPRADTPSVAAESDDSAARGEDLAPLPPSQPPREQSRPSMPLRRPSLPKPFTTERSRSR